MKKTKTDNKNKQLGICKLTKQKGYFVKSHILPKALTKPEQKGLPFYQFDFGIPPTKRWSSWYDSELVTESGENILMELDSWAISYLRKQKLVWSSWGKEKILDQYYRSIPDAPWGFRNIEVTDPQKLRLFFLSLLWRAAVTKLPEFDQIQMPEEDVETLRSMICTGNPEPISFYPTQLTQLSTVGIIHNYSPKALIKEIDYFDNNTIMKIPIFRFYFDGLIAHLHRQSSDDGLTEQIRSLVVGGGKELMITTQAFIGSMQENTIKAGITACMGFNFN
jgi:hypothetical protein